METLRAALERALAAHLPQASDHRVGELQGTSATGMSSETLLFDASWKEAGEPRRQRLVARIAPDETDVPVFPTYDIPGQFATISTVAALTDVPVPPPWWCEPDPSVVGSPFFVMGCVEGEVPPDVMPYNFGDSWLYHASPKDQARLQEATIGVIARLHDIVEPRNAFPHLPPGSGVGIRAAGAGSPLRLHFEGRRAFYEWSATASGRCELIEKGFAWLEEHWPARETPAVFNWGDSRIGNVLYRDFEPVAVLDWEMATIGPPELDVAWLVYIHRMFEDLAAQMGLPGMPAFLRQEDVASRYERITGREPRDLDWYVTYSCLQMAVVLTRTSERAVHFGERERPARPEEMFLNAPTLAALVGSA